MQGAECAVHACMHTVSVDVYVHIHVCGMIALHVCKELRLLSVYASRKSKVAVVAVHMRAYAYYIIAVHMYASCAFTVELCKGLRLLCLQASHACKLQARPTSLHRTWHSHGMLRARPTCHPAFAVRSHHTARCRQRARPTASPCLRSNHMARWCCMPTGIPVSQPPHGMLQVTAVAVSRPGAYGAWSSRPMQAELVQRVRLAERLVTDVRGSSHGLDFVAVFARWRRPAQAVSCEVAIAGAIVVELEGDFAGTIVVALHLDEEEGPVFGGKACVQQVVSWFRHVCGLQGRVGCFGSFFQRGADNFFLVGLFGQVRM